MLAEDDFSVDPRTGNVLLGEGEPLRNKSHQELSDAAIYSCIDIRGAKSAVDIERIVTAYFMLRLYNGKQLEEPERRSPKRAKMDAPKWHQTVRVSLESPVSSLVDSI